MPHIQAETHPPDPMPTCRYSGLTLAKNLVMILTGILTGLVCVGLNKGTSLLIKFRNTTMANLVHPGESVVPAFLMNLGYGVSLTAIGASMARPRCLM